MQSYKTHIFRNAYIFSSKLASTISQGLNVTHLIHLFITKIKYHHIQCAPLGIAVKIAGRIKGHCCCLGLLGVKVGTILWAHVNITLVTAYGSLSKLKD